MPVAKNNKKSRDEDEAYHCGKAAKPAKVKDPNAPKRPMSSFFLFMNSRRDSLKEEKPGLKFGEMTKMMTNEWKEMKDKSKWEKEAEKAKARY